LKKRIDQLLVELGLAESRNQAQALILAGSVLADEQKVEKPGHTVKADAVIRILEKLKFASRGGLKLQAALDHFSIPVDGRVCADLGASTGGFTDCLLQRGARTVCAFDVGHDLLAWKLRIDPRVVVRDGFNARNISAADLPEDLKLVTMDLSFISVTKVLPSLRKALREKPYQGVDLIILVKPQFEVGKGEVGKGGIVRDEETRRRALESIAEFAHGLGFVVAGKMPSPIAGAKGNEEFLLYLQLLPDL
jgi:23S rRNA (cytidine1920-2'-O)/16S rRNA (cytidine1409-2'-O)-methyltransferase